MANREVVSGSFNRLFIGIFGQTSALTRVNVLGTGGYKFHYEMSKKKFVPATGQFEQTEAQSLTGTLKFLSDDQDGINLAMGHTLGANEDDPADSQKYILLMCDDYNPGASILIPICQAVVSLDINRSKGSAEEIPGTFSWVEPNSAKPMFYKRTNAAITTVLAGLSIPSPF